MFAKSYYEGGTVMKKIYAFLLLVLTSLVIMTSCQNSGGSESGGNVYGTATVYTEGMSVMVVPVNGSRACSDFSYEFEDKLESRGIKFNRGTEYNQIAEYEILIGLKDPERPATIRAYELLERMDKYSYFEARYLVYADSGVISIAFDKNEYTNITAIECITDTVLDAIFNHEDYVAHAKGVILSGEVNLIDEQEILDKEQSEKEWAALEKEIARRAAENSGITDKTEAERHGAEIAQEIVSAFKAFHSMYGDDIVDWTANLYDPGIGAFYSSSSGRDGAEYGPDAENTVQLIRMLINSGMCDNISTSGNWKELLPKEMQVKMVYFAKSIQDPDGYFYHPQWDKTVLKQNSIRMSRDLGWCTSICTELGFAPTYDTPRGVKGDGITADEFWEMYGIGEKPYTYDKSPTKDSLGLPNSTSSLRSTTAYAVSKAVAVSDVMPAASTADKYTSHEAYMDYLLDELIPLIKSNPYTGGSTVGEAPGEILAASGKLGKYTYVEGQNERYRKFDGMTIAQMVISELNAAINEETGFWGNVAENHTGTEFYYTNGFMKMMAAYNGLKAAYPAEHMKTAAQSLMTGLLGDEPSRGNILEVYNIWVGINRLVSNLSFVDDPAVKAEVKNYINVTLDANTADAILNSLSKVKAYQKYDGGFSHNVERGTPTHSSLPVSTGANQSDNDATSCALSIFHQIFQSLSLSAYEPTIYQESDWMRFLNIILEQSPVIKYDYDSGPTDPVITYEETPYANIVSVTGNDDVNNTYDIVLEDEENGVLQINKRATGSGFNMSFNHSKTYSQAGANVVRYEMDIRVNDISNGSNMEFYLRGSNNQSAYSPVFILFKAVTNGEGYGDIMIQDYGCGNNGPWIKAFSTGEWVNFAVEYRTGGMDEMGNPTECEYRVFVNDKLILVSNRVYGKYLSVNGGITPLPTPAKIENMVLLFNFNNNSSICFDNTLLHQLYISDDGGIGTAPPIDSGSGDQGGESGGEGGSDEGSGPIVESFDEMPSNITTGVADGTTVSIVNKGDNNKALYFDKDAGTSSFTYKQVGYSEKNADVATISLDILVENVDVAKDIEIHLCSGNTIAYLPYFTIKGTDENSAIGFKHNAVGTSYDVGRVGEWFNVKIKYYGADGSSAARYELYVDNKLIGSFEGTFNGAQVPTVKEISKVVVVICNKNVGDFYFDNFSFSHLVDKNEEDEAPVVESFDTMPTHISTSLIEGVTATIVDKGDNNKALFIDKTVSGDKKTVSFNYDNVNVREKNANVAVFGFDILVENVESIDSIEVYPRAGDKKPFLPYFSIKEDSLITFKHNVGGNSYEIGKIGEWISIQIRIYDDTLELVVNGELVDTFSGTWKSVAAPAVSAYSNLQIIVCMGNQGDFYFDNMYVHHLCDSELGDSEGGDTPDNPDTPEDTTENLLVGYGRVEADPSALTFDSMPAQVVVNIPTTASASSSGVKTIMGDGKQESVLYVKKVDTGKGNSFGIRVNQATASNANANKVTLSADILVKNMKSKSELQLQFANKEGYAGSSSNYLSLILISFSDMADGSAISIRDYNNGAANAVVSTDAKVGEWFNICVEYYEGVLDDGDGTWEEGEAYTNVYVNGSLVINKSTAVYSNKIHTGALPLWGAEQIDFMLLSMNMNLSADIYYDNLSIVQSVAK